jgi:hypothetical protein
LDISGYKTKSDNDSSRGGAPDYVVFKFEVTDASNAASTAGTAVTTKSGEYDSAVGASSSATAAWSAASTHAVDLSGAYDNFETAVAQYNAALAVQTSALAAAGSDIAGALYDAAQRAITATNAALTYLRQCTTALKTASVNLSGDMVYHANAIQKMTTLVDDIVAAANAVTISGDIANVNTEVGPYMEEFKTRVVGLHVDAVNKSDAVLTTYKAYIDAAKAEADAKAALDNIKDRHALFLARYEATKESADDAFDVAEAQHISAWTDTSDALVRSAALDSSAYLAVQDWSGAVVTTAEKQGIYDTTPSQANADALAAAQAAQNNKYLLAQAAVTKYKNYLPVKAAAHAALTTAYYVYISAKNADAPSTPSDFPNPKYGDLTNDIDTHTLSTMEPFASA